MGDPRQKEYQRTYHQKQLDRGLVRVSVYVPARDKEEMLALARERVAEFDAETSPSR